MSKIIRNRQIAEDDWTTLADDAPFPTSGRVIVSLKRWQEERAAHKTSDASVGVRIPNTASVPELWAQISDRPLIALEFPAFGDGRAYSQARLLRERFNYEGEVRAVGDVLRDQVHFMHRVGFDVMVPRADQDLDACLKAFRDFSLGYQGAVDDSTPIFLRRAGT
jgi:uncharacterized protein (DUF934 family)